MRACLPDSCRGGYTAAGQGQPGSQHCTRPQPAQQSSARACLPAGQLGTAAHAALQSDNGGHARANSTRLSARPPPAASRCLQPHRSGMGWTEGLPRHCPQRLPAPTAPMCLSPGLHLMSHSAQSSAEETPRAPPPAGSHKPLSRHTRSSRGACRFRDAAAPAPHFGRCPQAQACSLPQHRLGALLSRAISR